MLSFKHFLEEVKKPTGKLKDACWTGYTAVGMKKKNGREVPNCVPVKEDGVGGGMSAGPTNVVSSGSIAGSGGKGGEPGVSKKRNPILKPMARRYPPQ
jgi:hypothetical protein